MLAQSLIRDVANLIYPPRCVSCGQLSEADPAFCATCSVQLSNLVSAPACDRCASPLGEGAACPYCQGKGIHPFEKIVALAAFRPPIRKLIHQMKYRHRWPLAEILADRLLAEPRIQTLLAQTDLLIPIPLHYTRQILRGYNQADALASRLAGRSGIPLARSIIRFKNTPPQTLVASRQIRAENLRDAFSLIRPRQIAAKRITLIDDVMTTAATLKNAARALSDGHPASISAIVVAVADPRRRDFQTV
jgi:ComF family protein